MSPVPRLPPHFVSSALPLWVNQSLARYPGFVREMELLSSPLFGKLPETQERSYGTSKESHHGYHPFRPGISILARMKINFNQTKFLFTNKKENSHE